MPFKHNRLILSPKKITFMRIIAAQKEHLDILISLNEEVQNLHVNFAPEIFKEPLHDEIGEFFRKLFKDKNWKVLIGFEDDQPAGYISLQIVEQAEHAFCYDQKWLYIDQIGVKEEYRGKGVGKELIEAAKDFAKQHNINRIVLDVWSVNENAKKFFMKQGFSTFLEKMKLDI